MADFRDDWGVRGEWVQPCRYCGAPTIRLECDDCYLERHLIAPDDLAAQVNAWSLRIEGLTHHGSRVIESIQPRADLL